MSYSEQEADEVDSERLPSFDSEAEVQGSVYATQDMCKEGSVYATQDMCKEGSVYATQNKYKKDGLISTQS